MSSVFARSRQLTLRNLPPPPSPPERLLFFLIVLVLIVFMQSRKIDWKCRSSLNMSLCCNNTGRKGMQIEPFAAADVNVFFDRMASDCLCHVAGILQSLFASFVTLAPHKQRPVIYRECSRTSGPCLREHSLQKRRRLIPSHRSHIATRRKMIRKRNTARATFLS
jgi:hypothetical protein